MNHLDFKLFARPVEEQFNKMANDPNLTLLRVNIPEDEIWELYLNSYPTELNTIFRQRKHYDGNYDRNFIKRLANLVAFDKDLNLQTIWDVKVEGYFQQVADNLKDLVLSKVNQGKFSGFYLTTEKVAGSLSNRDNYDATIVWDHFYSRVPDKYVVDKDRIGTILGEKQTGFSVLKTGLDKFSIASLETVLDLIYQNSLYRGNEFKFAVSAFLDVKKKYEKLNTELEKILFCYKEANKFSNGLCRFKNTVIGTLVDDIEDGVDLDKAVASFESKVAPTNYKRTSSVVTKTMLENARKKLIELDCEDSIYRRFATESDIPTTELLFSHSDSKVVNGVFDELIEESNKKVKNLDKVEEISIEDFLANVLPKAKTVEALVDYNHMSNFVTLTAPQNASAKGIFAWKNPIAWAYNGDVTDSITERVKNAGGNVEGEFRISLAWHCADDLDLHLIEPDKNHIYYSNNRRSKSRLGGQLDLDMNGLDKKDSENPVENIYYATAPVGKFKVYVNNYGKKGSKDNSFTLQVAYKGQIFNYSHERDLRSDETVDCLEINLTTDGISIKILGKGIVGNTVTCDMWGVKVGSLVPVSKIMLSPNYWGDNKVGNKHYIFALKGCNSDEPQRGFFNEFLSNDFKEHRKVFEVLGSKTRTEVTDNQVAGLGFSSTKRSELVVKVTGSFSRMLKIKF